ncbi:MAG: hypothetical protein MGU50_11720 [Trichodesmium sp. MAG_R02]|nr:hypothetical protein [Trichodesmium sp. MAG_R02]
MHATSLQGFAYGDVVHKFEKRCQGIFTVKNIKVPLCNIYIFILNKNETFFP